MRQIVLTFLTMTFMIACSKSTVDPDTFLVDLTFLSTNTSNNVIQGQDIVSNVRCLGPDLCYKFSKFEITETAVKQFEIRAKSTYPNPKNGDIVCLQAIYYKDTTVKINASTKGKYILKFLNNNQLFKADTVQVN